MTFIKVGTQKVLFISIASVCLLLGIITLLTPSLISTKWGNETFLKLLNAQIPGRIDIQRFSVSWFGVQKIEGLSLIDPKGNPVLQFASLESETPLYAFLSFEKIQRKTKIGKFNAVIQKTEDGKTNLQESLGIGYVPIEIPNELASLSDVDIEVESPNILSEMKVKASGATSQGSISGNFDINFNCSDQDSCKVSMQSFPISLLDGYLAAKHPELTGLASSIAGDSIDFSMTKKTDGESSSWKIQAESEFLKFFGEGKIEHNVFYLTAPAKAKVTLTPEAFKALSSLNNNLKEWQLTSSSEILVEISEIKLPLEFFNSSLNGEQRKAQVLKALLTLKNAKLTSQKNQGKIAEINDISLKADAPEASSWLVLHGSGSYNLENTPVSFQFDTKIEKPSNLKDLCSTLMQPHEIRFALENMPTDVLDRLFGTDQLAKRTFGNNLTFHMETTAEDFKTLQMSISSQKIKIPSIQLRIDQNVFLVKQNKAIPLTGFISIDSIGLLQSSGTTEIGKFTVPWSIQSDFSKIDLKFSGNSIGLKNEEGKFSGKLAIDSLTSIQNAIVDFTFVGSSLPASFLEWISGRDEISPLFGQSLNLNLSAKGSTRQGGIRVKLGGAVGEVSLNASFTDRYITLKEPLVIETRGSEELGRVVLSKFAPIFNELVSSDGQIRLTISPDYFSFPVLPFNLEAARIGSATLDMGKLTFYNAGDLKNLLSVLKTPRSEMISIWTTPIYINLQNGIVNVYRTDLLIMERYPIASWGKIDLDRDEVNMVIGLSGTALAQAMEMPGLEGNAMVQIPITGTTRNAKIDNSKAAAKIGSLIAQQSGRPEGLLIGTVLNLAKGKEGEIPPPTTNPLPWKDLELKNPTSEREPGKIRKQETKDPMKEIQKEASNLLKGFFR